MRLIDGTRIEQFILNNCSDTEEINTIYAELINAPTIDAVPVVRCGECKNGEETITGKIRCKSCFDDGLCMEKEDFCSYGERRSDER